MVDANLISTIWSSRLLEVFLQPPKRNGEQLKLVLTWKVPATITNVKRTVGLVFFLIKVSVSLTFPTNQRILNAVYATKNFRMSLTCSFANAISLLMVRKAITLNTKMLEKQVQKIGSHLRTKVLLISATGSTFRSPLADIEINYNITFRS